ncbi:hypothetical protein F1654_08085 [Alkalicaulis satelles]|uniref:Uncharacterized protein n=1 Tax=Alkalicaulis satelles TaxID=2609175 RepID=A0A5M6ZGA2_9PROT|nr:hypothetical protein [Alkalicaulis satelles]KAA5803749.1 hypothetical protein F1654_08085 [Alkalicaulis satelles]
MFQRGLNETEIALLEAAGFPPEAVQMIVREAEGLRWLFLKRSGAAAIWWIVSIIGAVTVGSLWQATGLWGSLAIPVLAIGLQAVSVMADHEINLPKSSDPPRWAARMLAAHVLRAAGLTKPETSDPFFALQAHAEAVRGASGWASFSLIARRLAQEARKDGSRDSGPYSIAGALRFGLIILAISAIIVLLALGARPF